MVVVAERHAACECMPSSAPLRARSETLRVAPLPHALSEVTATASVASANICSRAHPCAARDPPEADRRCPEATTKSCRRLRQPGHGSDIELQGGVRRRPSSIMRGRCRCRDSGRLRIARLRRPRGRRSRSRRQVRSYRSCRRLRRGPHTARERLIRTMRRGAWVMAVSIDQLVVVGGGSGPSSLGAHAPSTSRKLSAT